MSAEELINKVDIGRIADEGERIYEARKSEFSAADKGKFLAINTETGELFLGDTSLEAVKKAQVMYPDTFFSVVRIGYSAAETMEAVLAE